jgi:hypothetical protein
MAGKASRRSANYSKRSSASSEPENPSVRHTFLAECGYERRFQNLSQFDDWYVLSAA